MSRGTHVAGPITRHLADDHERLDALLDRSVAPDGMRMAAFDAFRAGILRHIGIEEKVVFPALRDARGGEPHPDWKRLRIDHGAITSLLVPSPTPELVSEIRSILEPHNVVEESRGSVYAECDQLPSDVVEAVLERMRAYPPVRVAAYRDGPRVLRTAADALRVSAMQFDRAGPTRGEGA